MEKTNKQTNKQTSLIWPKVKLKNKFNYTCLNIYSFKRSLKVHLFLVRQTIFWKSPWWHRLLLMIINSWMRTHKCTASAAYVSKIMTLNSVFTPSGCTCLPRIGELLYAWSHLCWAWLHAKQWVRVHELIISNSSSYSLVSKIRKLLEFVLFCTQYLLS